MGKPFNISIIEFLASMDCTTSKDNLMQLDLFKFLPTQKNLAEK